LHGDGTLSQGDIQDLKQILPSVRVIPRNEVEEKVLQHLSGYPNCREYRAKHAYGMKLFDVVLLSEEDVIHFTDSDILYVNWSPDIFLLPGGVDARFSSNGPGRHAYSIEPWRVWPLGKIRLVKSLNSGLFSVRSSVLDLDHLEWLLGELKKEDRYEEQSFWVEQTCWAALASRVNSQIYSFEKVTIPLRSPFTGKIDLSGEDVVAIHFVSTVRDEMKNYEKKLGMKKVEEIITNNSKLNDSLSQLISDIKNGIKNKLISKS
jgi:hypothetical protein